MEGQALPPVWPAIGSAGRCLRENAAYFVHRLSLLRLNWFLRNPIQRIRSSASHRQPHPPLPPAVSPLIWTVQIQDNASYHKDAEVWAWFKSNRHWLEMHHLPPYSPA